MNINICFIIAQVLGTIIFILNIVGSTKLTTKKVYTYNSICNGLTIIEYSLLGAYSGALCCFIAVVRNFIFAKFKKKVPIYVLLIYITLVVILNLKLIKGPLDIIPIVNIIMYAMALWTKDIMNIKIVGIYTCVTGIVYDIKKGAYISVLNQLIDGIVGILCVIKLMSKKKRKQTL